MTSPFSFHNDGAFYLAQFLVDSVYNPLVLEDLELIKSDHFDLSNEDVATLDQRLSRSLAHLDFPDWWNLLGADATQGEIGILTFPHWVSGNRKRSPQTTQIKNC